MALLLDATLTALVLAGALVLAVGVGSAPFLLRRGPASGPAVSTVVGERETERQQRQNEEIEQTDRVAGAAIETGSVGRRNEAGNEPEPGR